MHIILTMALTGGLLFLSLILIEFFNHELFTQRQRYTILKAALLLHVIPVGFLKSLLVKWINDNFLIRPSGHSIIYGNKPSIMITPDKFYMNVAYRKEVSVICIWLSMALLFFLASILFRIKARKEILNCAYKISTPEIMEIKNACQSSLHIRKDISVYFTKAQTSPFTFGIRKPIIILPEINDRNSIEMILRHELCHIRQKDSLTLFLRFIIVGIYWFHPLIFILDAYLETACELACDELTTEGMSVAEKKKYGTLIIKMSTAAFSDHKLFVNAFSNHKKKLKERISSIMKKKKKTKFALVLTAGMILSSSFPVLAYNGPQITVLGADTPDEYFVKSANETIEFIDFSSANEAMFSGTSPQIVYDFEFIDQFGNIFSADEIPKTAGKCTQHSFVDGTSNKHIKNSDGSCVVKIYSSKRCSKCGEIRAGDLLNKIEYLSCPH